MEILLNLSWLLLSLLIVCLWLRFGCRAGASGRMSPVALIMLIVILFPVISVSDDLWSIQNPAETDTCQRRDQLASCPHAIFPAIAALPAPAFAMPHFGFRAVTLPVASSVLSVENPALDAIQNRPPPAA